MKSSPLKLSMNVTVSASAAILRLKGRICFKHEATLFSTIAQLFLKNRQHLIVELSGIEMIDSAGIGELVLLYMQARATGCEVRIVAPVKRLRQLLELTNIAGLFETYSTVDAALDSLPSRWSKVLVS